MEKKINSRSTMGTRGRKQIISLGIRHTSTHFVCENGPKIPSTNRELNIVNDSIEIEWNWNWNWNENGREMNRSIRYVVVVVVALNELVKLYHPNQ